MCCSRPSAVDARASIGILGGYMFVLRTAALSAAMSLLSFAAYAEDGFILNAIHSTQKIFVVDNGKQVCALDPGQGCSWSMTVGDHRVEVLNGKGASIYRDFSVPSSMPGLVVEDSAFRKRRPVGLEDLANGAAIP